jgi:hypothetical protein
MLALALLTTATMLTKKMSKPLCWRQNVEKPMQWKDRDANSFAKEPKNSQLSFFLFICASKEKLESLKNKASLEDRNQRIEHAIDPHASNSIEFRLHMYSTSIC